MHVLLLILKILGITLGSILGVVLLLILLVMLVPIRYSGTVKKHEDLYGKARISWLLHLLHATVTYENKEPVICVRLFGFTIYPKKEKPAKPKKKKKYKKKKNKSQKKTKERPQKQAEEKPQKKEEVPSVTAAEKVGCEDAEITSNVINDENDTEVSDVLLENAEETAAFEENADFTETTDSEESFIDLDESDGIDISVDAPEEEKQKKSLLQKYGEACDGAAKKVKEAYSDTTDKIKNIYNNIADKLKNIYNKWVKLKAIIDDQQVKNTVSLVFRQVGKVLKHILPRKINGTLDYGFEDPSITGYITAVFGALYGKLGRAFTFRPDFEKKILETDIDFKGRIRLGRFVEIALKVLFNKDFRHSYKLIKSRGEDTDDKDSSDETSDSNSDFDDDPDLQED